MNVANHAEASSPSSGATVDRLENIKYCIRYLQEHTDYAGRVAGGAGREPGPLASLDALLGTTQGHGALPPLTDCQRMMRAMMNIWQPQPLDDGYLRAQDAELQAQLRDKGVVTLAAIAAAAPPPATRPGRPPLLLWQGDITRLGVDAIVNAANSSMLGCWHPLHACIDNAIHSAAGLQLRAACADAMRGDECPPVHPVYSFNGATYREAFTTETIITEGYNLPCRHVLHTVGPIVPDGVPTAAQERQLAECYRNCIGMAVANGCRSVAFCCISTGEFRFPHRRAAEIAVATVLDAAPPDLTIVFNVFKDIDRDIYSHLLATC